MSAIRLARSVVDELLFSPTMLLSQCSFFPLTPLYYSSVEARLGLLVGSLLGSELALPQIDRLTRSTSHLPGLSSVAAIATSSIVSSAVHHFFPSPFVRGAIGSMYWSTFYPFLFKPVPSIIGQKFSELRSSIFKKTPQAKTPPTREKTPPTRETIQETCFNLCGQSELIESQGPLAKDARAKAYMAAHFIAMSMTAQISSSSYPIFMSAWIGLSFTLYSAAFLPIISSLNTYLFPSYPPGFAPSENALFFGRLFALLLATKGVPKALPSASPQLIGLAQSVSFLFLSTMAAQASLWV